MKFQLDIQDFHLFEKTALSVWFITIQTIIRIVLGYFRVTCLHFFFILHSIVLNGCVMSRFVLIDQNATKSQIFSFLLKWYSISYMSMHGTHLVPPSNPPMILFSYMPYIYLFPWYCECHSSLFSLLSWCWEYASLHMCHSSSCWTCWNKNQYQFVSWCWFCILASVVLTSWSKWLMSWVL